MQDERASESGEGRTPDDQVRVFAQLVFGHLRHVKKEFEDGLEGRPGSLGARELDVVRGLPAPEDWERHLVTAVNVASLMQAVSGDHLACFAKVLDPPMPLWGFAVPARAAIETAATGYWLLDSGISPQERVARSLALRRKSAEEATRTVARLQGGTTDEDTAVAAAVAPINEEADALGIQPVSPPSATTRVGDVLSRHVSSPRAGEGVYKYLSAIGHGAIYAAVQRMLDVGPGETELHRRMEPNLDITAVHWTVIASVGAHSSLVDRLITYHGIDPWAWEGWQRKLHEDLGPQLGMPTGGVTGKAAED
jgi:hypothetical protein